MHVSLGDYLTDIVQNAVEAGANLVIADVLENGGAVEVNVADNGKGMDEGALKRAFDPFYTEPGKHAGRRVGLGLPFLRQAVEQAGGMLDVKSEPGTGTSVHVRFPSDHVDTPPAGDMAGTLTALMALPGGYELVVHRRRGDAAYTVSRNELAGAIGDLETAGALGLARRYFDGQEETLQAAAAR